MGQFLPKNLSGISRTEVLAQQATHWRATIAHVSQFPDYVRHYPILPSLSGVHDLQHLPILDGSKLAELSPPDSYDFVCTSRTSGIAFRSGGTTSHRKTVYHSWESYERVMHLGQRGLLAAMKEKPVRIINCFGSGSLWGGFLFGQGITQLIDAQSFAYGNTAPLAEIAEIIAAHQIDTVFAYPSFFHALVTSATVDLTMLRSLRQFFYLGEALTPDHTREILSQLPGLHIKSLGYSSNETGPVGYQCRHQDDGIHHIHDDFMICEIIDPETERPLSGEEVGEVVVTTLCNTGMPLFRYRIGDLARRVLAPCPCGEETQLIQVLGRTDVSAKICGIKISIGQLLGALGRPCPTIIAQDVQVVTRHVAGSVRIEVRLNAKKVSVDMIPQVRELLLSDVTIQNMTRQASFGRLDVVTIPIDEFVRVEGSGKVKTFMEVFE